MAGGIEPISKITPQIPVEKVSYFKRSSESIQKPENIEKESERSSRGEQEDTLLQMGDVVAVSEYGDTLQVSEEGKDQLEEDQFPDGTVKLATTQNTETGIDVKEKELQETEDQEEKFSIDTSSYKLYTDARLEQMYLEGEISRHDYEVEIERREQEEKNTEDQQAAFSNAIGRSDHEMQSAERTQDAIEQAFSDQASQTTDPKLRMDALEQLENSNMNHQKQFENQIQFQVT